MNPRLMLIASMTIFGTLGIFVRNIPVSSGELALYRAVLAALLIAVFLLLTKQRIPFANIKKEVPLLLASGVATETVVYLYASKRRIQLMPIATPDARSRGTSFLKHTNTNGLCCYTELLFCPCHRYSCLSCSF